MKFYDTIVYLRGQEPRTVKTAASVPAMALSVAINNVLKWPKEEQELVVGVTLKIERN